MPPSRHERVIDAVLLALVLVVYLCLLPQAPHMDGIRWAHSIESQKVLINPNYLLMQPVAMLLFRVWAAIGMPQDATLFATVLDSLIAVASLAVFSGSLKVLNTPTHIRVASILLLASSYNFFYLATSDHIKLITAPFLMMTLHNLICYARSPELRPLKLAGIGMGLSICTLINAAAWLGVVLPLLYLLNRWDSSRALRHIGVFLGCSAAPCVVFFPIFYLATSGAGGFVEWMTTYGADPTSVAVGFRGLTLLSLGRLPYSYLKNFAYSPEISELVKSFILETSAPELRGVHSALNIFAAGFTALVLLSLALFLATRWRRFSRADRRSLLVAASMVAGFSAFGFFWNAGDEEFWFQITAPIVIGLAIQAKYVRQFRHGSVLLLSFTAVIAANQIITFAIPRHVYPYERYIDELVENARSCGLLVYDTDNHRAELIYGASRRVALPKMSIMAISRSHSFDLDATLEALRTAVVKTAERGDSVCVFGVFESSDLAHPWTYLAERFGITRQPFVRLLRSYGPYEVSRVAGQNLWSRAFPATSEGRGSRIEPASPAAGSS